MGADVCDRLSDIEWHWIRQSPRRRWDQPRVDRMPTRRCCLLSTRALTLAASNVSRRGHNASHPVELVDTAAARANRPGSRRFPSLV